MKKFMHFLWRLIDLCELAAVSVMWGSHIYTPMNSVQFITMVVFSACVGFTNISRLIVETLCKNSPDV